MGEAVTSCIRECSESAEKGADISTGTKMMQMNNTVDEQEEGKNGKNQYDKGPTQSWNLRPTAMVAERDVSYDTPSFRQAMQREDAEEWKAAIEKKNGGAET